MILASGQEVSLETSSVGNGSQRWELAVTCQSATGRQGLTLSPNPKAAPQSVDSSSGDRAGFSPVAVGQARLANTTSQPVALRELWWYNARVYNTGFPRFAVLYSAPAEREINWFLAAFLVLGIGFLLWSAPAPTRPGRSFAWAMTLLVGPGLGLAASLAMRAWGLHLVLAWDAVLLLAGLGPLALRIPRLIGSLAAIQNQPSPWYKKRFTSGTALALLVMACAAVVLMVEWPQAKTPFDAARLHKLQAAKPDYVILGNSMAGSRIDTALLGQLAGGAEVFDLHRNQSYSTIWYLLLKNTLVASGVKPRAVFLLFRDSRITNPWQGAAARRYRAMRERYSRSPDPLVERITHSRSGVRSQLQNALEPLYRLSKHQSALRAKISLASMDLARPVAESTGGTMHAERRVWERQVNQRFRLSRLRGATPAFSARAWKPNLDFKETLHDSFLPAMIDLAKKHGFELVLVRVKTRSVAEGQTRRTKALGIYAKQLRAYLKKRGVGFYDFTHDPAVTEEMYGNRDHIAREHRKRYTRLFYQRLRPYFQTAE